MHSKRSNVLPFKISLLFIQPQINGLYHHIAIVLYYICTRQKIVTFAKFAHGKCSDNNYYLRL